MFPSLCSTVYSGNIVAWISSFFHFCVRTGWMPISWFIKGSVIAEYAACFWLNHSDPLIRKLRRCSWDFLPLYWCTSSLWCFILVIWGANVEFSLFPFYSISSTSFPFLCCRPVWFSGFRSTFSQCHQDWLGSDRRYSTLLQSFTVLEPVSPWFWARFGYHCSVKRITFCLSKYQHSIFLF